MFYVDVKSSTPIYEQIKDYIKEGIVRGIFLPGAKLPSVRDLSVMLTVNPNTVSKAYQELEREGAIETRRGRGTFIVERYQPRPDQQRLEQVAAMLRKVVVEAYYLGLPQRRIEQQLSDLYSEIRGPSGDI